MTTRTKLDLLKPRSKRVRYFVTYLALLLGAIVAKITVRGRHHLPKEGPFIIAINHFNYADPPFVVYAIRRPINFLAASDQVVEWFNYWAVWLYGFIPTNRTRLGPSTIKTSKKILEQKEILGIFPEGNSLSNKLRPAKGGVVFLSTTMQVPIIPVGIYGLRDNVWIDIFKGIRPKLQLNIGKAFGPVSLPTDRSKRDGALKEIGDKVMCRIGALLPDECHGKYEKNPLIEIYRKENKL